MQLPCFVDEVRFYVTDYEEDTVLSMLVGCVVPDSKLRPKTNTESSWVQRIIRDRFLGLFAALVIRCEFRVVCLIISNNLNRFGASNRNPPEIPKPHTISPSLADETLTPICTSSDS